MVKERILMTVKPFLTHGVISALKQRSWEKLPENAQRAVVIMFSKEWEGPMG